MATANVDIALGLGAPTSIELRVNAVENIALGLTAIGKAYVTRSANLTTITGLTARGGFGDVVALTTTLGLSGTVGPFLDGIASVGIQHGLSGAGSISTPAILATQLGLAGAPTITGGTIDSTAALTISMGLTAPERIGSFAVLDVGLALLATGSVHFETVVTDMRLTFAADEIRLFWRKS